MSQAPLDIRIRAQTAPARSPLFRSGRAAFLLALSYVCAGAAANLIVARFGPRALPLTAFLIIPFDLVARDVLHDRWRGNLLYLRMAGLVALGALLSAIIDLSAWRIALASFCAFTAAGIVATVVYEACHRRGWSIAARVAWASVWAALADSLLFMWIAFGAVDGRIMMEQWSAKVCGAMLWGFLYARLTAQAMARARTARLAAERERARTTFYAGESIRCGAFVSLKNDGRLYEVGPHTAPSEV
jgi:hypothetical protein